MIAGFLGFIIPKCMVGFIGGTVGSVFVNFLDPFFIGLYMSLLFAVIGSKLHPVSEEETAYREQLMIVPEQERIAKEYKKDYVFGYILIAEGLLTTVFLLLGWALPYNGYI